MKEKGIFFLLYLFFISIIFNPTIVFANTKLFVDSPELSNLKKIKNIRNKKEKPNKDGMTYVGQKGLLLWNGQGILRFRDGGLFIGNFKKGALMDGYWIVKNEVSKTTFQYDAKGNLKLDSNGIAIEDNSEYRKLFEYELDYLKENIFLNEKISYKKYLELIGKDQLLAEKNISTKDKENKKKQKVEKIQATGFNSFSGELEDKTPYLMDAYYEDDCIKHGLVRYLDKSKQQATQEVFGVFENCQVFDSHSKFANVFFDDEGKVKEVNLHKKDVSHIYGTRLMIGVETKNLPNGKNGVQIVSFQENLPAIETKLDINDIIINVNNVPVDNTFKFVQLVKKSKLNEKIKVDFVSNKKFDKNFNYKKSDIQSLYIIPKIISSKIELRLAYIVKDKEYIEYLVDHDKQFQSDIDDIVKYEKNSQEWKERQKILQKDFWLLEDYYNEIKNISIKQDRNKKLPVLDFSQLYVVSNKPVASKVAVTQESEFKPDELNDNIPPVIEVANNFTFKENNYKIKGKVADNTDGPIYVEIDGVLAETNNGLFEINRFSPVDEVIKITAIDKWGNRSETKIIDVKIKKEKIKTVKKIERLNPSNYKSKENQNAVALIIGIEDYSKNPKASFANLDAKFFYEYARNSFGIKEENIKLMVNEEANLIDLLSVLNKWLPGKIMKNKSELYIYFAGHGLASNDGKELYFLPHDGDSDLLMRTGISRTELFDTIKKFSPKNTTIFLDTCYSGVSRDEKTLLASARPIRIVASNKNDIPDNFTIFSASQLDQISSGLKEAKHGIFSYYLMKGLEGDADLNKDRTITNGELLAYMDDNVSQKASELGRQQNPSLVGNPEQVLARY